MTAKQVVCEFGCDGGSLFISIRKAVEFGAEEVFLQARPDQPGMLVWFVAPNAINPSVPFTGIVLADGAGGSVTVKVPMSIAAKLLDKPPAGSFLRIHPKVGTNELVVGETTYSGEGVIECSELEATPRYYMEPPGAMFVKQPDFCCVLNVALPNGDVFNLSTQAPTSKHVVLIRRVLVDMNLGLKPVSEEDENNLIATIDGLPRSTVKATTSSVTVAGGSLAEVPAGKPRKKKEETIELTDDELINQAMEDTKKAIAATDAGTLAFPSLLEDLPPLPSLTPQTTVEYTLPKDTVEIMHPAAKPEMSAVPVELDDPVEEPSHKPRGSRLQNAIDKARDLLEKNGYSVLVTKDTEPDDSLSGLLSTLKGCAEIFVRTASKLEEKAGGLKETSEQEIRKKILDEVVRKILS